MQKKKYKMISINYTYNCAKKPRCSFCYLEKERVFSKLTKHRGSIFDPDSIFYLRKELAELIKSTEQVAIAYNGLESWDLMSLVRECFSLNNKLIVNITANPDFITPQISGLFHKLRVSMVALSLDSEKCPKDLENWMKAAKLLRSKKIKVGANILMFDPMFSRISKILRIVNPYCYQIHLLRPKFYKSQISVEARRALLFLLKSQYPNLFIDQCFRFELLGESCTRGKDFLSINPDGSYSLCSFDIYRDNIKHLKNCPYI